MTENEAIERLEQHKEFGFRCVNEAIDIAIQALEEIQQYRSIGTVEDIEKGIKQSEEEFEMLMEYKAIGLTPTMVRDLIKSCKKHEKHALENAHIVDEYREIGTVEECQKYKKGNCIARITFDEEKTQEIVKEQVKKFEIDIDTVLNDVIDSFIEKTEERISEIEDEYENLTEKNPYILMAKREFLNGEILAYRSAISIIREEKQ